jgi:uncharacterized protein YegL
MRRLPIYFLIDVSESMVGEQIQHVEEGLATIIQTLKTDPRAMETVWVSIIIFAGQAKTIVPLQDIIQFYPPKFPIGSGTSLSLGLGHLMYELRKNIVRTTVEQKGDWKPIIFLFTDGVPTDSPSDLLSAIAEWKQKWQRSSNLVAISFSHSTDNRVLGELTENVLQFNGSDASSYKEFFKWVSDSIKTNSQNLDNNSSSFDLATFNQDVVSKIDLSKSAKSVIDDNFVVIAAKCQNTKRPYLIKYRKNVFIDRAGDVRMDYRLVGAFPIDNSYFELSDEKATELKISSNQLIGAPTCPWCGNQFAFAMCECGKVHCMDGGGQATCPWCGVTGFYGSGGESGFDVGRTQG